MSSDEYDPEEFAGLFDTQSGTDALIEHWRQQAKNIPGVHGVQIFEAVGDLVPVKFDDDDEKDEQSGTGTGSEARPEILLSTSVEIHESTRVPDGLELIVVRVPWETILGELNKNPDFLYGEFDSRHLEELVAAAYDKLGFKVTLTDPQKDGGRDVIAIDEKIGIRIFDEIKCYAPGEKVGVDHVHKLHSVVELDKNVSKGFVTTTSDFTSGVYKRFESLIPHRLDFRNGRKLAEFLKSAANRLK